MATQSGRKKTKDNPKELIREETDPRNVVVNLTLDRVIFNATVGYRKGMGLSTDQDVMRLAIATFLKREGYLS